jgi:6-phosphogluconolactonase (cycloisomerase 2 family)
MALHFANTDNVTDDATLALEAPRTLATTQVGNSQYLFATGINDNGLSVFSVLGDGTVTNVDNVFDDGTLELQGAESVTTAAVSGTTYLFASGFLDNGVSVFAVSADGTLTNVDNVNDDTTLELEGADGMVATVVDGNPFLFVAGFLDNGVSVFSIAADGTLTNVDNVTDDATLELNGAESVTTAVIGGVTYLFVTSSVDDGVSVFSVAADGTLSNVHNVTDDATLELDRASSAATAVIGGTTYLFVSGSQDDGVSVFSVANNGSLTNVANVSDDTTLQLDGASAVSTALIGEQAYLFVTGFFDNGVSAFSIAANGAIAHVGSISDNAVLELQAPIDVTTAVIGGVPHLLVAGQVDDGVSIFSLANENVSALGDVLWQHSDGTVATAARELPSVSNTWQIEATTDFDGDGDGDILWRHVDGLVVTWEMENGLFFTNHNVEGAPDTWNIEGTGDFDGDGDADVIWRHEEGAVVTWEMEDGTYVQNHNIAFASTGWEIDGTGDFDGDGDDDIIWRHAEGAVVTWEMEDGAYVQNHNIAEASTSWQIDGTGDFDGDGDADILWRHSSGAVVFWEMQEGEFVTNHNLPLVPSSWQIEGTEDFDSDGHSDILWRHSSGEVVTWEMEDGAIARTPNFGIVPNAWQIKGTAEFDLA